MYNHGPPILFSLIFTTLMSTTHSILAFDRTNNTINNIIHITPHIYIDIYISIFYLYHIYLPPPKPTTYIYIYIYIYPLPPYTVYPSFSIYYIAIYTFSKLWYCSCPTFHHLHSFTLHLSI